MSAGPAPAVALRPAANPDRWFGRFSVACAICCAVLFVFGALAAPPTQRLGLLGIISISGVTVLLAAQLLRRGSSLGLLTIGGFVLMALGVGAGTLLPDGLDAAAVMPLAGAVMVLPAHRGRPLMAIFGVAFFASMLGEAGAYLVGGLGHAADVEVPLSLVESALMLSFTYGLVWWVGDRWWRAHDLAANALAGQRRLLEVNERLLATLDSEGVLDLIAQSLKGVVRYDNLTIYRVDRVAGLLRPVLARDRFAALILETTFPADRGITGWVVSHAEAQCINDAHLDPRTSVIPGTPIEAESLIVVPLLVGGEVAGTLNVGRMGGGEAHFQPDEFELVRLFAGQASIALQNAETHRAVRTRAETDALTGLLNRGAFDAQIAALVADPAAQPVALIMLDLDGFKDYNDRYGHPTGDALLRAAGEAIRSAVRQGDVGFRYGGDEFAILLPRSDDAAASVVADRVGASILAAAVPDAAAISASIGIAVSDGWLDAASLIAEADAALYRAKPARAAR